MHRIYPLYTPEIEGNKTSMIHRMPVLDTLSPQPADDLESPYAFRASPLRYLYQIGRMISMPMCNEYIISLYGVFIDTLGGGIARKKWVE
jgi:hypothetical protein